MRRSRSCHRKGTATRGSRPNQAVRLASNALRDPGSGGRGGRSRANRVAALSLCCDQAPGLARWDLAERTISAAPANLGCPRATSRMRCFAKLRWRSREKRIAAVQTKEGGRGGKGRQPCRSARPSCFPLPPPRLSPAALAEGEVVRQPPPSLPSLDPCETGCLFSVCVRM